MESAIENQCSALGGLFNSIVNDMKTSLPVWEDFICKAAKLHTTLRATILATGAFLDAFQKVADIATNTKGATRDIGSALTRLCMRHRSIENKLKAFTSSIMDCLVTPLQEKTEEWKKSVVQLDKDHAKEYKKARAEIKRASTDTVRLQKKVKKGKSDIQCRLDNALQDVNGKYLVLEETEKNSVRMALIEERSRFCMFITCLKPVVDEEMAMLTEITHLQEVLEQLCLQVSEPQVLPPASEQIIKDIKGSDAHNFFQPQTPPSSPSSLGSRKSSMCSISSMNSSSSGSSKSHSPSHHVRYRNQQPPPGTVRLSSVSSQDSGFTSQDALFLRPPSPPSLDFTRQNTVPEQSGLDSNSSTPSSPYPGPPSSSSTWTNWPDPPHITKQDPNIMFERPHTISTAYERSHNRPALTAHTFEPPDILERPQSSTAPSTPSPSPYACPVIPPGMSVSETRPPLGPKPKAKPVSAPIVPDLNLMAGGQYPPVYVNMNDLANMAAQKHREREQREMEHEIPLSDSQDTTPTEAHPEPHQRRQEVSADTNQQQSPNSSELADAIKELEASTAALQMAYETQTSSSSLQSSSGYGTLSSTPSGSEDTVASDDIRNRKDLSTAPPDKFSTIPRNGDVSHCFKVPSTPKRPASTAGIPSVTSGTATIRRSSMTAGKPPPPVRRNSSISGTPVATPTVPGSEPFMRSGTRSGSTTPTPQGTPTHHRRATIDVSSAAMQQALYGQEVIYQQPHMMPAQHQRAQSEQPYGTGMRQQQATPPPSQYASLPAAVPQEMMYAAAHYSQPPQYAPTSQAQVAEQNQYAVPDHSQMAPAQYAQPEHQQRGPQQQQQQQQHSHYGQGQTQYAQGQTQSAQGQNQYAQGQTQSAQGQTQSAQGQNQYAQGQNQYTQGQGQLPPAPVSQAQMNGQYAHETPQYAVGQVAVSGQSQYAQSQAQYAKGQNLQTQGQSQYAQGQVQYAQGQVQYAQGQVQYAQGQVQYAQGDPCYAVTGQPQYASNQQQLAHQNQSSQGHIGQSAQGQLVQTGQGLAQVQQQYPQSQPQYTQQGQPLPADLTPPNSAPPQGPDTPATNSQSAQSNSVSVEKGQMVKVKHAGIIESLNQKFASTGLAGPNASPNRRASCPAQGHEVVTQTDSIMLRELRKVKLRRTSTLDRSAPRLS